MTENKSGFIGKKEIRLVAVSKHKVRTKPSEVLLVTPDGWVVTKDGAYGDNGEDCEIKVEGFDLKEWRTNAGWSQEEMSWCLDISRPTYIALEQGKRDITLKEFLILSKVKQSTHFSEIQL